MEANSSHQDISDGSDTEEYNSLTEGGLNSSHTLLNSSASTLIDTVQSSSQVFTSSELQLSSIMGSECNSSRNPTPDSSSDHPPSRSQETTVKSSSELSLNSVVNSEREGDEDGKEACSNVSRASKDRANTPVKSMFFKATKFDILKAMKAEVLKATEPQIPQAAEEKSMDVRKSVSNEETVTKVNKETVSKVYEETVTEVGEETVTKDYEEKLTEVNEETVTKVDEETVTKEYEEKLTEINEEIVAKDYEDAVTEVNEETVTEVNEETVTKEYEEAVTEVNEETITKVNEEMEVKLSESIKDEVGNTMKAIVSRAIEAQVSTEMEIDVNEDEENKSIIASMVETMDVELNEMVEDGLNKLATADLLPEVEMEVNETTENKFNEAAETAEPSGSSVNNSEASRITEADTSESMEAGTSNRSLREEEDIGFGYNEDSHGSNGILEEEAKRLDELGFSSQITPDAKVEGGQKERDEQYKKLVDLLSKSKFYTNVLLVKVGIETAKDSRKRKHSEAIRNSDSEGDKSAEAVENGDSQEDKSTEAVENGHSQEDKSTEAVENGDSQEDKSTEAVENGDSQEDKSTEAVENGDSQEDKSSEAIRNSDLEEDKSAEAVENDDLQEDKSASSSQQSPLPKKKKIVTENQRGMYQVASEVVMNKGTQNSEDVGENTAESQNSADKKPVEKIEQPKLLWGGTLRDYQLEGFKWLKVLYENGVNGILADEMGLGKTVQVIALLAHLVEKRIKGPFLIIGPLSTLFNWMVEFKRFAPQLHITLFYGSQVEREDKYKTLLKRKNVNGVACFPIVITSYEIPCIERAFMSQIKWKYIIVDEGHRIKNYNTVLAKVLRSFDSANRLLLTGTPLHNSLSELWSLLNFLVPEIFDNLEVFESWFRIEELSDEAGRQKIIEEERRKNVLQTLHQILAPFMLRRIKSDVTLDIPKKKEVLVQAPMTDTQLKLYQAVLDKNMSVLRRAPIDDDVLPDNNGKRPKRSCTLGKNYSLEEKSSKVSNSDRRDSVKKNSNVKRYFVRARMQNPYMALKLIANHPYLIHYPLQEDGKSYLIDEGVIRQSGKFLVLDALLEKLHAKGHKVLIFSTLCMLLDVVEDYLTLRTYAYERLDGTVKLADRAESIQRFNTDPNIFIFLLSTRSGGLGVNLTGADTVIFLDSDWNPQVDLQAQDRCHRIGQTKPVMVYRLVTTGTIDEEIVKRASTKRVLEKMVISKGSSFEKEFDLEELKTILESKDHSEIVYTDGQVLTDEQLEKLLDRTDLMD